MRNWCGPVCMSQYNIRWSCTSSQITDVEESILLQPAFNSCLTPKSFITHFQPTPFFVFLIIETCNLSQVETESPGGCHTVSYGDKQNWPFTDQEVYNQPIINSIEYENPHLGNQFTPAGLAPRPSIYWLFYLEAVCTCFVPAEWTLLKLQVRLELQHYVCI